jgi:hypothetical protein
VSINAYDIAAEQSLLGAILSAPHVAGAVLPSVPGDAWWLPKHAALAAILSEMLHDETPIDPTTVLGEVMSRGLITQLPAPYLHTLIQCAWSPQNASEYADRVRELWSRRELSKSAQRLTQRLDGAWENGMDTDVVTAVAEMRLALETAETSAATTDYLPMSMDEVLSGEDTYDWLVPGLLERGERIVITGGEGAGKSVLCSQIGACLAAGLHPFTGMPLGSGGYGVRVLVVDCENNIRQTRRRYRRIVSIANGIREMHALRPTDWKESMFVELRPAGIDLLAGRDVAWLERAVSAVAPDLLLLGPLYRLHRANPSDEAAARELVHVIDSVRVRHNCALLTEAHAGHAQDSGGNRLMRPAGSSLFLRWPEFGYGLRRASDAQNPDRPEKVDVVAWRGSREERAWPRQLQHGHEGLLPWRPANPDYWEQTGEAV